MKEKVERLGNISSFQSMREIYFLMVKSIFGNTKRLVAIFGNMKRHVLDKIYQESKNPITNENHLKVKKKMKPKEMSKHKLKSVSNLCLFYVFLIS